MKTVDIVFNTLSNPLTNDGFLSGEKLASRCGISRQAVWKAVNILRSRGAKIEAVSNRGYHLIGTGDILSEDLIYKQLQENIGAKIIYYEKIDSTNNEAKRCLAENANVQSFHKNVIVASKQSAGRGRMGRTFYSVGGRGVYLSIMYAPNASILLPSVLTATASVGVCRAIKEIYGVDTKIKWVNDIFLNGKKVCGILTEGVTDFDTGNISCAIIGIGVNILLGEVPEEIKNIAGAILNDKESDTKRSAFVASIINNIINIYESNNFIDAMEEYRSRSLLINKKITVHPIINKSSESYSAIVKGISDDAKLIVETTNGNIKYLDSGEVSLHSER